LENIFNPALPLPLSALLKTSWKSAVTLKMTGSYMI
jgi:hypothetical protein